MEIPRQQFAEKLFEVEKAIKECDVIAIDTELSGECLLFKYQIRYLKKRCT